MKYFADNYPSIYVSLYSLVISFIMIDLILLLDIIDLVITVKNPFKARAHRVLKYKMFLCFFFVLFTYLFWNKLEKTPWMENIVTSSGTMMEYTEIVLVVIQFSIVICWLLGLFLLNKKGTSNEIRMIIFKRSVLIAIILTVNAFVHAFRLTYF